MADEATVAGNDPFADAIVKLAQKKGDMKSPSETETKEEPKPETESTNGEDKEQPKAEETKEEVKSEDKQDSKEVILKGLDNLKKEEGNENKSEDELREILKKRVNSSLNPDNNQEPDKAVFDLDGEIKTKTNGQFESLEDLLKATNQSDVTFANDQIKHLNDLASKGVEIDRVLAFNSLKIDKLDPSNLEDAKRLIKHEMKLGEPDITEKEMNYELSQIYDLSEKLDEMDEVVNTEAIEHTKLKLQRQAKKAKETLLTKQKELEIPASDLAVHTEEQKRLEEKQLKEWEVKVEGSLKDYDSMDISLGDDRKFKYSLKQESLKSLKDTMLKPEGFLARYVENGQANMEKFRKDMIVVDNFNNIVKALYSQGESAGAEKVINSITNPSTDTPGVTSQKTSVKSIGSQLAEGFRKANI